MSATDTQIEDKDILTVAKWLARENAEAEPAITEIYLFPNEGEIRLVAVDPTTLPKGGVEPFYFGAAPEYGIPYPSAIALIRPDERENVPLPNGWGTWGDARRVWPSEEKI